MTGEVKYHVIQGCLSNLTLLEAKEGLLLFDTGAGAGDIERLERYMQERLQLTPAAINLAVISHIHADHAGGAEILREKYQVPLAAHERMEKWYAGCFGALQHRLDKAMITRYMSADAGICYPRVIVPDHRLADGDRLPGFRDWQVVWLPGHTIHDIGIFNERARLLCYPDMFININGKIKLPIPVLFKKRMKHSLQRLIDLHAQTMLPGHGAVLEKAVGNKYFAQAHSIIDESGRRHWRTVLPQLTAHVTPEFWRAKTGRIPTSI